MASLQLSGIRTKVMDAVDLKVAAGELVLLSGPSGSGKSLLLRAIADLDPHEGEALIDGSRRSAMPAPEWRRRVGLLPAEPHWWAERVGEHFPSGNPQNAPERSGVSEMLRRLGFESDVLGWSVSRLSTGERQRLAFARLIANGPEVLLLDEGTANLDPVNREHVESLAQEYRLGRGAAVLWVSHDPQQRLQLGGRRLVIRNARLEPEP